jgi:hypothetical protein
VTNDVTFEAVSGRITASIENSASQMRSVAINAAKAAGWWCRLGYYRKKPGNGGDFASPTTTSPAALRARKAERRYE